MNYRTFLAIVAGTIFGGWAWRRIAKGPSPQMIVVDNGEGGWSRVPRVVA